MHFEDLLLGAFAVLEVARQAAVDSVDGLRKTTVDGVEADWVRGGSFNSGLGEEWTRDGVGDENKIEQVLHTGLESLGATLYITNSESLYVRLSCCICLFYLVKSGKRTLILMKNSNTAESSFIDHERSLRTKVN